MSIKSEQRELVIARDGRACCLTTIYRDLFPKHRCRGWPQCMHVLPSQSIIARAQQARLQLRRGIEHPLAQLTPEEVESIVVGDPDNGLIGCEHGHGRWDRKGQRPPRDRLPGRVEAFSERWGLEAVMVRWYGELKASAHSPRAREPETGIEPASP